MRTAQGSGYGMKVAQAEGQLETSLVAGELWEAGSGLLRVCHGGSLGGGAARPVTR